MKDQISQRPDADLLFWRMTEAMDIPLDQAIQHDALSTTELSKMLDKCARCPAPHYCALFLAARAGQTDAPPAFCPNRKCLGRLRDRKADVASTLRSCAND